MNTTLPIPEWHRMAIDGKAPPVRIPLNGWSMSPLIRRAQDYVTIIPVDRELVPGDIVLIAEPDIGRYVMHRVWEIRSGQVETWGDNCERPDGWYSLDAIWGRAILIERGNRKIKTNPKKGMRWAKIWHQTRKVYQLYDKCRNGLIRRFKKMFV